MIQAEQVLSMYREREKQRGPILAQMREIRSVYNAEIVVPMPEMDRNEKNMVANLVNQGIDQTAGRVSSTMPNVTFLLVDKASKEMERLASKQRDCVLAWWYENRLKLKQRRRARWLLGYAMAPVMIRPDWQKKIPKWVLCEPLNTFPAPAQDYDELTPSDCIWSYERSYSWICERYPDRALALGNGSGAPQRDDKIELLEYNDPYQRCLVAISKNPASWESRPLQNSIMLEWAENESGICWAVCPGRITLDRPQGQFDGMIGMYQAQAKLMALSMISTEKDVFKDTYLVSRQGERAQFISGPHDGRTGKVNIVAGGDIQEKGGQGPGYQTAAMLNMLERNQRLTGGIPAEFGGESPSNVRTGRRGDAVLSAVVDFPVQEAQELFQYALQEENKRAIAIDKTYFNSAKTFYVSWKGAKKPKVDYKPSDLWKTDINFVSFAHAGADINALIVGIGQRIGMRLMSVRTGQELDPFIEDPELEHDRTITEGIEQSILSGLQQQASTGAIPPNDLARIMQLVKSDRLELADAIIKAQEEAQERQASVDAEGNPTAVDPMSPEAQPGMAQPGMGAEAGTSIPEPGGGQKNLAMLLNQMRGVRQGMGVAS